MYILMIFDVVITSEKILRRHKFTYILHGHLFCSYCIVHNQDPSDNDL
jgi:hypothetical protein